MSVQEGVIGTERGQTQRWRAAFSALLTTRPVRARTATLTPAARRGAARVLSLLSLCLALVSGLWAAPAQAQNETKTFSFSYHWRDVLDRTMPAPVLGYDTNGLAFYFPDVNPFPTRTSGNDLCFTINKVAVPIDDGQGSLVSDLGTTWRLRFSTSQTYPCTATYTNMALATAMGLYTANVTIAITNTLPVFQQTAFTVPLGQTTTISKASIVTDADGDLISPLTLNQASKTGPGCGEVSLVTSGGSSVASGVAFTPSASGGACSIGITAHDGIATVAETLVFTAPAAQTISFTGAAPTNARVGGATYTPAATATSGLAVAFALDASSTGCALSGGVVSFTGVGTCVLNANQAGDASFQAASQVQQSFAVAAAAAAQTITFTSTAPTNAQASGATYTPTATATSGLAVAFALDATSTGCALSNGVVSFTGAGTCVLNANQAGNNDFLAASQVQQSFTVLAAAVAQTINFTSTAPTSAQAGVASYTPTATATSGLTVAFTLDGTSTGCSLSGGVVSFTGAGTCRINANQAGNTSFLAASQVQQAFTVIAAAPVAQTITFNTAPRNARAGGASYTPAATATSGLTVAFTLDGTSTGCSLSGGVVSFTSAGTCRINANQAGDASFLAASQVQQSFTVAAAPVVQGDHIVFPTFSYHWRDVLDRTMPAPVLGNDEAGLPLYFTDVNAFPSQGINFCYEINKVAVPMDDGRGALVVGVGTTWRLRFSTTHSYLCTATYTGMPLQTATTYYSADITIAITNTPAAFQQTAFTAPVGQTTTIPKASVVSSPDGDPISLTLNQASLTGPGCGAVSVVASGVEFTPSASGGACSISATANDGITTATQTLVFTAPAAQTISFTGAAPTNARVGGATYTPAATATSGLAVAFALDASSTGCSLSGGVVSFTGVGTCVLNANQAGDASFQAASQVQQSFAVAAAAAAQTITFTSTAPTNAQASGATYTPTATATSGLAVAFALDGASTGCSLSGGVISFTGAGTCVLNANQAGNNDFLAASQVQQSFTVLAAAVAQTINFTSTAPTSAQAGGATYTPTATATSGLTVAFTLDGTSTGCSLSGGVVSFTGAGTCRINANQAGNTSFLAASQVQQSFTVIAAAVAQTINFTSAAPTSAQAGGASYTPTATATSGLTVALTLDGASTGCSLSGGVVSFSGAGTCVLNANQAGDAAFLAAPQAQQSFTVIAAPVAQTINVTSTAPTTAQAGGATYTPTATATSGLTVAFTLDGTSTGCSLSGGVVTFTGAGTCVLNANQAGSIAFLAAAQVQQSFAVAAAANPVAQTLTFSSAAPTSAQAGGASYTPVAGATSGLAVVFTLDGTSTGCALAGGVVSFTGAGTCVLNANQAGNASFLPAPQVQQTFTVLAAPVAQTINFTSTAPTNAQAGGASYTPTATATSGLAVAFTLDGASTGCSLSGGVVSFTGAGTCRINANQAGNVSFLAATQVQQTFTVIAAAAAAQTINFTSTAPTSAQAGGASYTPTATATSGLAVAFTLDGASTGCSLSGGVVSFTGAGTCRINANQAGNVSFLAAAQVQQTFTVIAAAAAQTINFTSTAPTNAQAGGASYTPTATATSGLTVAFTLDGASTGCSLSGGVVSFTSAGTCRINANQAGNTSFLAAAQVQQTFTVTAAAVAQTINFTSTAPTSAQAGGPSYTPAATATSGLAVAFTLDGASTGCLLSSGVVSFTGAGTCRINANQAGDANFLAATQAQQAFTVSAAPVVTVAAPQTISFTSTAPTNAQVGGASYAPSATATSGLAVVFTLDGGSTGCALSGGVVSFTGAGTCVLNANQPGDVSFLAAAQAQQSFTVAAAAAAQTISFTSTAPSNARAGGASYTPAATATSGLAVVLTLDGASTGCALSGGVVSFTGAGTCVLNANQAGDASVQAALQVQQSFAVSAAAAAQTISFTSAAPTNAQAGGASYTPAAVASSGLAVAFTLDGASTGCALSGGVVSFTGAGTCVLNANQAGNNDVLAAPQVQQSFTVAAAPPVRAPQTIVFTATPPASAQAGGGYVVAATASSGLAVSFSLDGTSSGCSLSGASVSFIDAGTCRINANQAGNDRFLAAPQAQQSVTVSLAAAPVEFTSTPPATAQPGGSYTVTVAASGAAAAVISLDPASTGCALSGSQVVFTGPGVCRINADLPPTEAFPTGRRVQQSITIEKTAALCTLSSSAAKVFADLPVVLTAACASQSGRGQPSGTVTFTSGGATLGVATLVNGTGALTTQFSGVGDVVISAQYSGDAENAAASFVDALKILVDARPDPAQNGDIQSSVTEQASSQTRFGQTQIDNIFSRLQELNTVGAGRPSSLRIRAVGSSPRPVLSNGATDTRSSESEWLRALNFAQRWPNHALGADGIARDVQNPQARPAASSEPSDTGPWQLWTAGDVAIGVYRPLPDGKGRPTFTTQGVTAGYDRRVSDKVNAGFAVGFAFDTTRLPASLGRSEVQNLSLAAYANARLTPETFLSLILGSGSGTIDSERGFAGEEGKLSGARDTTQLFATFALTHDMVRGGMTFSPYARLDAVRIQLAAYEERGMRERALRYDRLVSDFASGVVGARLNYPLSVDRGRWLLHGRLEYRRRIAGDYQQRIGYANETSGERYPFLFSQQPIASESLDWRGGLRFAANPKTTLSLDYQGNSAAGQSPATIRAGVELRFP
ncbi:hypothetical protein CA606_20080 [Caulobacter vibrioides]|uniref:Autotransporter domain-containing protein n=1 Tax=Caulobacter vibrioides TaxID=155892 RepID=A0A2S1B7K5_CAUVI|nr:autotransporter domain-containing protein [Caulobacter vibrioides]AWC68639.1 hypothetical protein CA606_20080 [Caulobacter vibrioides]